MLSRIILICVIFLSIFYIKHELKTQKGIIMSHLKNGMSLMALLISGVLIGTSSYAQSSNEIEETPEFNAPANDEDDLPF